MTPIGAVEAVTVVIPVFDRARFIGEAVESVLAQTWPDVRVVVVDDGSTDSTAAVVERLAAHHSEVALVRQPNAGPSAARNRGLREVTTRLVTFLDSDDLMLPERVEVQLDHLRAGEAADGVIGIERIDVEAGVTPPRWVRELPPADAFPRYYNMSLLIDRAWLDRIDGFDERVHIGEDIDLMVRLRAVGARIATLDQVVVIRRIHGDNLIYREDEVDASMLQAIQRHLAANRPGDGRRGQGRP